VPAVQDSQSELVAADANFVGQTSQMIEQKHSPISRVQERVGDQPAMRTVFRSFRTISGEPKVVA
jgi:hypothetical protein